MRILLLGLSFLWSASSLADGTVNKFHCAFEVFDLVKGKPMPAKPSVTKEGTVTVETKVDRNGDTQGLVLKADGFVAHVLALKLPDAVNGTWGNLQLEIRKDSSDRAPRALSHTDLTTSKAVNSLLLSDKCLVLTCER